MNEYDAINNGIFFEDKHRIQMKIPPNAFFIGFTLINDETKVFVNRIVLSNEGCTFIYMTPKQMRKTIHKDLFICPYLQLVYNLSLSSEEKTMPLAVYGLDDGESTKMLFASFEDDDIERVFKTIPSPSNSPFYS
ncbi:hypothetical protein DWA11_03455 [Acinetobacter baumannii]|jgi:hypothetical protein|uniref:hypothetical protein n=7 Tax=Acinetobacter baumannii TaxID=470 RepID=UPI000A33A263|nr:hypothetical protein [Acinetobacter baumannii]OTM31435.1 hypothetical protein B9X51_00700 [Acinetobacter baumannii]RDF71585.1 hypothetical protein DV997_03570 [Acinetobacter baumannii]RDF74512.1 hypothetical protein DWA08_13115 [Acinetobacter baumannii]RSF29976.1 hypothetical protein EGU05_17425 [Acinetobacter baumannii]TDI09982.1 hypothetical protein DWA11_03455 [Acinetobacter baumannii]